MESRGTRAESRPDGRPAIARRSCDSCRARKVACERGDPCSNCISAKIHCTYSAVAPRAATPKQRVLISSQYEQKLDRIAQGIDTITQLLQSKQGSTKGLEPQTAITSKLAPEISHTHRGLVQPVENRPNPIPRPDPTSWDYSAHIIDFVKTIVDDTSSRPTVIGQDGIVSSLKGLLGSLENPSVGQSLSLLPPRLSERTEPALPPVDAAIKSLRWAKKHREHYRMQFLSQILPIEEVAETCQKVYFAVDGYDDVDLLLTTGLMGYVLLEYCAVTENEEADTYGERAWEDFHTSLLRLPLVMSPSLKNIALLMLGVFNAVEHSKASLAWTLITSAAHQCQSLGYHRFRSSREPVTEQLFWTVYKFEKGLALRLGRSSNFRDTDITLPRDPNEPRSVRLGCLQGKAYDQLFSPEGLSRPNLERQNRVAALVGEIRHVIEETRAEALGLEASDPNSSNQDPMHLLYRYCDLVCQSSLLTLVLRADTPVPGSPTSVSDECIAAARSVLDMHQQCMIYVQEIRNRVVKRNYINWALLNTPFVPFSILFTRAVQLLDVNDLARLDLFVTSLKPDVTSQESTTHPYRLYELLCQAARMHIHSRLPPLISTSLDFDPTLPLVESLGNDFDFAQFNALTNGVGDASGGFTSLQHPDDLMEWYYGNQQIMGLLDEEFTF